MPEYFLILLGIFFLTLILQKHFKIKIYKNLKHLLIFNIINIFLATIWDQIAIQRGHWSFNPDYLLGLKVGYMPVEEFLFVLVLSYFALVLFKIIEKKI